jgi:methionyl-tRNA formyltransferase
MKIGFFGDGAWAVKTLDRLVKLPDVQVVFVCPRHQSPDAALRAAATEHGLTLVDFADVNNEVAIEELATYGCDLFISMSFDQIMRRRMFDLPRLRTINCHAGMLPFYRGRSVLNWALVNDEATVGITVHFVDDGVDTGDIILQRHLEISDDDDYRTLLDRGSVACAEAVEEAVIAMARGTVSRTNQASIDVAGSYFTRRIAGDETIDWQRSSREVFNLVRAVTTPGPGAVGWIGAEEWRILKVRVPGDVKPWNMACGAVIASGAGEFSVKTEDTFVVVSQWSGPRRPRVGERFVLGSGPVPSLGDAG